MSDRLDRDPRTAWAMFEYRRNHVGPPISEPEALRVLEWLPPGEHAEVLVRGRILTTGPWEDATAAGDDKAIPRGDDGPTGLGVRSVSGGMLIDPGTGECRDWAFTDSLNVGAAVETGPWEDRCFLVDGSGGGCAQVFTPTWRIASYLRLGTGKFILRLPLQPGVPPVPDLDAGGPQPQVSEHARATQVVQGWASVEEIALEHLRSLNYPEVRRTSSGRDEGIDVRAEGLVAQAKMTALPVGRPTLQQLVGAGFDVPEHVCYSTSGYTDEAIHYAARAGVALYLVNFDATVSPLNNMASALARRPDSPREKDEWRAATAYIRQVLHRVDAFLSTEVEDAIEDADPLVGPRLEGYLEGALLRLPGDVPSFGSPREAVLSYHLGEQRLAVVARHLDLPYPEPTEEEAATGKEPNVMDFY